MPRVAGGLTVRVAVLTPRLSDDKQFDPLWRIGFDRLSSRFRQRGHAVVGLPWDTAEAGGCDVMLPLLAWGYHHDLPRWRQTVDALAAAGARLFNPPSVLKWNADKRYLQRLDAGGAPVVPTCFVDRADEASVRRAAATLEADVVVVKPQVSGGAFQTIKVRVGEGLSGGPEGPAMVQAFLPSVATEGELSMLHFGGAFSHALTKTAAAGDFRVQPQFGGVMQAAEPDAAAFAVAQAVLEAVEEPLLYARVDLIRDRAGDWRLMELELVEPYLFLDEAPDGGEAFVRAVEAAAG